VVIPRGGFCISGFVERVKKRVKSSTFGQVVGEASAAGLANGSP
jgi:hypothetical protein